MNPFRNYLGFIVSEPSHIMNTFNKIDQNYNHVQSIHRKCQLFLRSELQIDFDDITVSNFKRIFWTNRSDLQTISSTIYNHLKDGGFLPKVTRKIRHFFGATLISTEVKTMILAEGAGPTAVNYGYQPNADEIETLNNIFAGGAGGVLLAFEEFHNEAWKRPSSENLEKGLALLNNSKCFNTVANDAKSLEITDQADAVFMGFTVAIAKTKIEAHFAERNLDMATLAKGYGEGLSDVDQLLMLLYLEYPESKDVWMVV